MILLTGFGPFADVTDNPSARLVRALHGRVIAGHRVVSAVLPVRWHEATALAVRRAHEIDPVLVLGFGVARGTDTGRVEARAVAEREGADAAGIVPPGPFDGPSERRPTVDTARLASALDVPVSENAGRYLCNAWLYQVPAEVPCPAGFVHLPDQGLDPERVVVGIERYLAA